MPIELSDKEKMQMDVYRRFMDIFEELKLDAMTALAILSATSVLSFVKLDNTPFVNKQELRDYMRVFANRMLKMADSDEGQMQQVASDTTMAKVISDVPKGVM